MMEPRVSTILTCNKKKSAQGLSCHCDLIHITIYFSNFINSPDYNSEILTSSIVGYLMTYLGFLVILNFKSELLFRNVI